MEAADKSSRSPLRWVAWIALGVIALGVAWLLASSLLVPASPTVGVLRTKTPTGALARVVVTPEPVLMETDRPVPVTTVSAPAFAVITNTPTAATILELLNRTIAEATRTATAGPPTAVPSGVVTATSPPTSTALPLNTETAEAQIIMITVEALTTGTWTPAPALAQAEPSTTAPTPSATPTASFTPTPTSTGTPTAEAAATSPLTTTLQLPFGITPAATNLLEGVPVAVVLGQFVNVRQGPGTAFPAIAVVLGGNQLSLIGRNGNSAWLNVCCANGQSGWIATYLLGTDVDVVTLPIQAPETTPTPPAVGALPNSPAGELRRLVGAGEVWDSYGWRG